MQLFPLSKNIFRNRRVVFRFCAAGAPYMGAFPERSAPTARKRPAVATSRREAHAAPAGVVFLLSLLSREGGAFFSVGARSILYRKPGGACTRRPFLGFPTAGACSREPPPAFSRSARRRQLAGGRLSPPQGLRHVPRRLFIAAVVRHPQTGPLPRCLACRRHLSRRAVVNPSSASFLTAFGLLLQSGARASLATSNHGNAHFSFAIFQRGVEERSSSSAP